MDKLKHIPGIFGDITPEELEKVNESVAAFSNMIMEYQKRKEPTTGSTETDIRN